MAVVTIVRMATSRRSLAVGAGRSLAQATGCVSDARLITLRPAMLVSSAMSPVLMEEAAAALVVRCYS